MFSLIHDNYLKKNKNVFFCYIVIVIVAHFKADVSNWLHNKRQSKKYGRCREVNRSACV